jgi:hypothetical protein
MKYAPEYLIGASDIGAILGLSPWQTPAQAWAKLSGIKPPAEASPAMARGNLIERALLWDVADREGVPYFSRYEPNNPRIDDGLYQGPPYSDDRKGSVVDPDHDWAVCRPDAWLVKDGRTVLVEAKTTRSFRDWEDAEGKPILPPAYYAQVQWQMFVTGIDVTLVEAFCTMTDERRSITVKASEKHQARIFELVAAWRQKHLIEAEMPDNLTAEIVGLVFPKPREPETWLEPTDDTTAWVAEYAEASAAEAAAAKRKEAARDRLCDVILDNTGIRGLCTFKATKRGRQFRLLKGGNDE